MKRILIALVVLFALASAEFVYDKGIKSFLRSSKKVGRDFSGSIAYGSFQYNGASCPTGNPGDTTLTGISINEVVTSGCFTDGSIAAGVVTETIGFICVPGTGGNAPQTIYFGLTSTNGFIIGGSNFVVGSGTSFSSGYSWGAIGAPSYTGPTTDGSCTGTTCSSGDFCNGPCTPAPVCTPSSGFGCTSTGTTTSYFINTNTVTAPSNCGGGFQNGGCCTTNGNFPVAKSTCDSGSVNIFSGYTPSYPEYQGFYELGTIFTSDTNGFVNSIKFYNPSEGTVGYTGFIGKLWDNSGNLLASVNFPAAQVGTFQVASLNTPVCISSNTIYRVSVNCDLQYYPVVPISSFTNGHLTFNDNCFCFTPGSYPGLTETGYSFGFQDICFSPATCIAKKSDGIIFVDRNNNETLISPSHPPSHPNHPPSRPNHPPSRPNHPPSRPSNDSFP